MSEPDIIGQMLSKLPRRDELGYIPQISETELFMWIGEVRRLMSRTGEVEKSAEQRVAERTGLSIPQTGERT